MGRGIHQDEELQEILMAQLAYVHDVLQHMVVEQFDEELCFFQWMSFHVSHLDEQDRQIVHFLGIVTWQRPARN